VACPQRCHLSHVASHPLAIERHLRRLDREWEIERVALKLLRGDFAETTRWANGRALESDRALQAAKA